MEKNTVRWTTAGALAGAITLLAGCGSTPTPPAAFARAEAAPTPTACPAEVPATATCLGGKDSQGAYYLIAKPADWNGHLVLHAHGGPSLGPATMKRAQEDLTRWAIMVKAGYAYAGSSFRQGGVEVRAAAEDTERLRRIFLAHVGKPKRTILHGQSWGGGVAAKAAEMYTQQSLGERPYDAVLLTSGLLAGGTRTYDFRTDLRAVYQYLCNNHPRPSETAYPLNIGLPVGDPMTPADLRKRVDECLALDKPAAQRTPEQQAKVRTLENVIRVPASSLVSHLNWATFHFRDISSQRTGGASPFGNMGVRYRGSSDDEALNRGVVRMAADPAAYRKFSQDTDPTGRIPVPVLTAHWIGDPTVFVEVHHHFRQLMDAAGQGANLVQTFTTKGTHSYISDPTYPALMAALLRWVDEGVKPTPAAIAAACPAFEPKFGAGCSFDAAYTPPPLESRVPPRQRP
ncbi:hypothetical protein [Ramlibacter rhizophilus]|uniref:Alpha/beta hydrolase n=1 Tax=Ramlibacter rhizophilus TaxID=1781167 RepID=A0A4Z0C3Y2_9BURK|nr:hypothetical protein [Ramlibacter rhizophilus]TFZ04915.1 hypothetical protein EZ242_03985 [Ramlibacter rhizophilus]